LGFTRIVIHFHCYVHSGNFLHYFSLGHFAKSKIDCSPVLDMSYYYTRDHLGSVREMCSSSGTIVARYSYDPYGRTTLVSGSNLATKQYTGDYYHATSGLYLTKYRAFDPNTGRWLRQPIAGVMPTMNKNKGRTSFLESSGAFIAACSASIRTSQHTGHPHPVFVPANHRIPSDRPSP